MKQNIDKPQLPKHIVMPRLQLKTEYYLEYVEKWTTRRHQSGYTVEYELRNRFGNYEYMGKYGGKYHFYDNIKGFDIHLDKDMFLKYWKPNGA